MTLSVCRQRPEKQRA